jgi:hypothetical protein
MNTCFRPDFTAKPAESSSSSSDRMHRLAGGNMIMDTKSGWSSTAGAMWLWPVAVLVGFRIGGTSPISSSTESIPSGLPSLLG